MCCISQGMYTCCGRCYSRDRLIKTVTAPFFFHLALRVIMRRVFTISIFLHFVHINNIIYTYIYTFTSFYRHTEHSWFIRMIRCTVCHTCVLILARLVLVTQTHDILRKCVATESGEEALCFGIAHQSRVRATG